MVINVRKSCCLLIGPRNDFSCDAIQTSNGVLFRGLTNCRFLDIFIVRWRNFKCSLTNAKKSFSRSANAIFGKIGRIAPEEATLDLINSKCIPVLIYGLEACSLLKSDLSSLDFVVNRFLMNCSALVLYRVST